MIFILKYINCRFNLKLKQIKLACSDHSLDQKETHKLKFKCSPPKEPSPSPRSTPTCHLRWTRALPWASWHWRIAHRALQAATLGSTGLPEAAAVATPLEKLIRASPLLLPMPASNSWRYPSQSSKIVTLRQRPRMSAALIRVSLNALSACRRTFRHPRREMRCSVSHRLRTPVLKSTRIWAFASSALKALRRKEVASAMGAALATHREARDSKLLRRCAASGRHSLRTSWTCRSPLRAMRSASEWPSDRHTNYNMRGSSVLRCAPTVPYLSSNDAFR